MGKKSGKRMISWKAPVKLIQLVKIANSLLVFVKSVPLYHVKLTYVVLHMAVKEVFETYF